MQGTCLCGKTRFRLAVTDVKAYQCFCSLCRLQSGTESNLGTIVRDDRFEWLTDTGHISHWRKDSGFSSDFCSCCGSPVPNRLRNSPCYWVPVGTLDATAPVQVVAHLCLSSRVNWDTQNDAVQGWSGVPDLDVLLGL